MREKKCNFDKEPKSFDCIDSCYLVNVPIFMSYLLRQSGGLGALLLCEFLAVSSQLCFVFKRGGIKPWWSPKKEVMPLPLVLAQVTTMLTTPGLYIEFSTEDYIVQTPCLVKMFLYVTLKSEQSDQSLKWLTHFERASGNLKGLHNKFQLSPSKPQKKRTPRTVISLYILLASYCGSQFVL